MRSRPGSMGQCLPVASTWPPPPRLPPESAAKLLAGWSLPSRPEQHRKRCLHAVVRVGVAWRPRGALLRGTPVHTPHPPCSAGPPAFTANPAPAPLATFVTAQGRPPAFPARLWWACPTAPCHLAARQPASVPGSQRGSGWPCLPAPTGWRPRCCWARSADPRRPRSGLCSHRRQGQAPQIVISPPPGTPTRFYHIVLM